MGKLSKNLSTSNLADYDETQAAMLGPIFYQAWADFQVSTKNKRRKLLKRKLDKRRK